MCVCVYVYKEFPKFYHIKIYHIEHILHVFHLHIIYIYIYHT